MESLESNKCYYGVVLVTVADLVSERFVAVKVDDVLEHWGTSLFLKKSALPIIDGRHRCSCIPELTDSGEPETEMGFTAHSDDCYRCTWLPARHRL